MRRVLAAAIVALLALPAASTAARPRVTFPRDHFGHPGASIEWWYFTALAHDSRGTPYLVFFTLFSSGGSLVPVSQVTNLRTGAVAGHSEQVAPGSVSARSLDVRAGGARLSYAGATNTWSFSARGPSYSIAMRQQPRKPYVLNGGGTGVIRQAGAGPSHYYSATRMTAAGTLHTGGKTLALTGQSWLDHQWGNFRDDPAAFDWNWFSCRFDGGTELMLYQFLDRATGRPLDRFASGTYVAANGKAVGITRFGVRHGARMLRAAGHAWPLDWRLSVPSQKLVESLRALVPDQLVRGTFLPTFWEGAASATGSRAGTCVVEISRR